MPSSNECSIECGERIALGISGTSEVLFNAGWVILERGRQTADTSRFWATQPVVESSFEKKPN